MRTTIGSMLMLHLAESILVHFRFQCADSQMPKAQTTDGLSQALASATRNLSSLLARFKMTGGSESFPLAIIALRPHPPHT